MDFSKRQADPRRHLAGITFVILFHIFIVYALVTGLAKKVVDVVRAPIETKVIEEIKKPPPPPEIVVPPPPKLEAPPPPYIPPPEVQIATPPPPAPTITAITPTPPPAPVVIAPAPPPPVVAAAPPAPPPAAVVTVGVACSNYKTAAQDAGFPAEAVRKRIFKGEVLMQFRLTASGEIKDIKALRASNPIFARQSERVVLQYKCEGQGQDVVVTVPMSYTFEE